MFRSTCFTFALLACSTLPSVAGGRFAANDTDFLNLMGNHEGYRGYGTVSDYAPVLPDREVERMTIGEILAYQERIRAMGTRSSAVGRYQFIHETLSDLVEEEEVSPNLVFDEEVQTYLARFLMEDCGFYDTEAEIAALGNCLAGRWAALPMLSGPQKGLSAHEGDGLNHASIAPETFLAVLESRFTW
ncbi:hypothetical protein LAZ40_06840 [Cereibacter sphaeroides]|uniref:hypothetical protein n=1 Tax=Cereibacter sphaeroides TaxID=1063 RepID=UPI001F4531DD|nr:hypothetical protein [Cereibacter sphaeroides]MCE6958763.1 hypothetical protein [Cereibacter sphaeroides]MCE6973363.1 hypothetical protein [Cereibacter sphaeroides]